MKKFLFTLLTLFMASSAFAEGGNYFYMDNFKVVKTKLGTTTAKVTVKGHFDNYVSAWQFDLGYVNENGEVVMNQLPKGVTKLTSAAGTDMKNMTYRGDDGEVYSDYSPNLKKGQDGTRIIVASDQADYSPEGEQYGPVKWVPGEYNQMWTFTFTCDADFTGAELVMRTAAACGNDTRPEVANNRATGVAVNAPNNCVVSVEYIAPEPVLTWDENNYTMTAALPEGYNAADYEIVMMANGVEVQNSYTVAQTSEDQTIEFTAYTKHAAGETYDSNDATYGKETKQTVTVPAKVETDLPFEAIVKVNHTGDENNFYLLYRTEGNDPDQNPVVTVTVTVDGTPLTNVEFLQNWTLVQDYTDPDNGYMKAIYNHVKLAEPGEHTVKVELTVAPGPGYAGDPKTASAEWKYTIKNKFQGEIVFGDVDPTTGKMKVSYNGTEEDYTMSISLNGQDAEVDEDGMIQLKEGENKIFVTVSKVGYDMKTAEATPTWTKPAQTAKPNIAQENVEGGVKVTATGEGTVKLYVDGVEVENPYIIYQTNEDKTYKVTATAQKEGELISETATLEVTVPAKPVGPVETKTFVKVTSAAQLVAGKNYIFVCGDYAMGAQATGDFLLPIAITGGDEVEVGTDVAIMTLGGSAGAWTLALGDQYLTAGNSTNLGFGSKATEWVITNNEGALAGFRAKHHDYSRAIRKHNSMDRFGNYSTSDVNSEFAWIYVEKTDEPVLEDLTGEITIGDPDDNGGVAVAYTGNENVTLAVTVKDAQGNVVPATFQNGVVTLPEYGTYTVEVVASADGYNNKEAEKEVTWTKPTPKELTGEITIGDPDDNGGVAVAYTGNENVTLAVTVKDAQGNVVPATFENGVVTLPDYGTYTVEVVASADGYNDKEANKEVTWTKPTPKELTGKITFSVTQGNKNNTGTGIVTATYDGEETGVTVKIVGYTAKVAAATSEGVRLPDYGTYQVKAVATAEGYANLNGEGEVTWDEPQTAAPVFTTSENGDDLTITATGEGTVTLYVVYEDGNEAKMEGNSVTFNKTDKEYTVKLKAVAHVEGAKDGETTQSFVIPAKSAGPATGVNELVDGKAVKSVRYFNMAGQEMQEVNGVTIVVTTYTDGTTSAVKVMK